MYQLFKTLICLPSSSNRFQLEPHVDLSQQFRAMLSYRHWQVLSSPIHFTIPLPSSLIVSYRRSCWRGSCRCLWCWTWRGLWRRTIPCGWKGRRSSSSGPSCRPSSNACSFQLPFLIDFTFFYKKGKSFLKIWKSESERKRAWRRFIKWMMASDRGKLETHGMTRET